MSPSHNVVPSAAAAVVVVVLTLLFGQVDGIAASVAARVLGAHQSGVAVAHSGETMVVAPTELVAFLASGTLPPSQTEAFDLQTDKIIAGLSDYGHRLEEAQKLAVHQNAVVQAQEANLSANFEPTQQALAHSIENATDQAAKAEATTLLERVTRMHYTQVGQLDATARFWEERLAKEKELTRVAEAKSRLEQSATDATKLEMDATKKHLDEVVGVEKARLDQWLDGYATQAKQVEEAARVEALKDGVDSYGAEAVVSQMRLRVISEVARQAQPAPPGVPTAQPATPLDSWGQ